MATSGDIAAHDRLIETSSKNFARDAAPLLDQLYDAIAASDNPSRTFVQSQFQPLRQLAQSQLTQMDAIITDNIEMNSSVIEGPPPDLSRMREETVAALNTAIDEEQNRIITTVVTGAVVGVIGLETIRALRRSKSAVLNRLRIGYSMTMRNLSGAVTLLYARNSTTPVRFRYVGGVVAESRPFCRQHAGDVFTEAQIRRIWNTQSWQGKRPGDPFVVRGGYNCRHSFVPVRDDE